MSKNPPLNVGDVWLRVSGSMVGEEICEGYELSWEEWRCERVTKCGGWFRSVEWGHYKKLRFALASGALWLSRSKEEALRRLIARKRRHLAILSGERAFAEATLEMAEDELRRHTRQSA